MQTPPIFPDMYHLRQHFPRPRLENIDSAVHAELEGCGVRFPSAARIAVAVGSRGIAQLPQVVRATAAWVKAHGGEPFLVPAMGSHGGATAEGQRRVLESYGVTEDFVQAPILASMQVIELPRGDLPVPLYFDQCASQAYGTIVINRIKPHTDFHGPYESGLMKMIVIGLGKHAQALAIHQHGVYGLRELIPLAARAVIRQGRILLGLGLVENAYEEIQSIQAIPAVEIPEREPELLAMARQAMARLPVEELDVLVIDRFGKDISGAGLDTNIIGRLMIRGEPEPISPRIATIILRDLTPGSHGNATGMGLADLMLRRAFEKIDFQVTNENLYTSSFLARGRIPMLVETDEQALTYALRGAGVLDFSRARVIRILDTLHLTEMTASRAVVDVLKGQPHIEVLEPVGRLFDRNGCFLASLPSLD